MKNALHLQLERIQGKLTQAKTQQSTCFGSTVHGFELAAPLAEDIIAAFEQQYRIVLPEDYRTFLLRVGQGGAGPYYGIAPLGEGSDRTQAPPEHEHALLARPFPLSYKQATASQETVRGYTYEAFQQGSLYLCDQGCAYCARLVVTGEARGRIVYLDQSNAGAPYFVKDLNFLDWYERWLDLVVGGDVPLWFGFDNPAYEQTRATSLPTANALATQIYIPKGPFKTPLERLRAKLLGSWDITKHHSYGPPLSPEQLADFEHTYQVKLPEDYAAFISSIQSSGVGPYYGLFPFKYAITSKEEADIARAPFPYSIANLKHPDTLPLNKHSSDVRYPGTISLCHQNRGYYAWLVISGEARGHVVYVNIDEDRLPYFVQAANFLEWYESWVDASLAKTLPPWWFGYDNPLYTTTATTDQEGLSHMTWTIR
jgi:hypothetical protein